MKLSNIEKLRDHVLDSIEKMANKKLAIEEMSIIAKSSETVISSVKLQLQYSAMIDESPNIPFLQECHDTQKVINVSNQKLLPKKG